MTPVHEDWTAEGLQLALCTLRGKWRAQGAVFQSEAARTEAHVTQAFTFDGQPYEVTVQTDRTLRVVEVVDGRRFPVSVPRGLTFPKGFVRSDTSRTS